jgi:hypothetical protein
MAGGVSGGSLERRSGGFFVGSQMAGNGGKFKGLMTSGRVRCAAGEGLPVAFSGL